MKKIAILGPRGTYCDIAATKYLENNNLELEKEYYPSIIKSIHSVNSNTVCMAPIENALDGVVTEALDEIIKSNLNIKCQLKLPIDFAFVSNNSDITKIKYVYVQFKAYGQCLDFINQYDFEIIKTESNILSLNKLQNSSLEYGAIIPIHKAYNDFKLKILNVADTRNNETRFFLLDNNKPNFDIETNFEASLVFTSIKDKPGVLYNILKEFYLKNINLKLILSRPSKSIGKYNFYIEINAKIEEKDSFIELINEFMKSKDYKIKLLGIYNDLGE